MIWNDDELEEIKDQECNQIAWKFAIVKGTLYMVSTDRLLIDTDIDDMIGAAAWPS